MTNTTTNANCPVCSKPVAGRGKCKSYAHIAIGPRKVGQVYADRFTGNTYEVIAIDETGENSPSWFGGWSITVRHTFDGTLEAPVTHCTPFEAKRYTLVIA